MARVLITGSADGLGRLSAKLLVNLGHQVVLHARNSERARHAFNSVPGAEDVLTGDLSDLSETIRLAEKANEKGKFDAIIHNAGVYRVSNDLVFAVNSLAPYILTCLINRPNRLIYLTSGLHMQGSADMDIAKYQKGKFSYADSKLHMVMLAKALSRKWPAVYSNAVNPGWVPTKMGGINAPDDLMEGAETQVWLATSNDIKAMVSGKYFFHKKEKSSLPVADDILNQQKFLDLCEQITGVHLPES